MVNKNLNKIIIGSVVSWDNISLKCPAGSPSTKSNENRIGNNACPGDCWNDCRADCPDCRGDQTCGWDCKKE